MKSRPAMGALVALSLAGSASLAFAEPSAPGQGRANRPSRPYTPKVPTTDADHERLRLAAIKRARKSARQAKGMTA